MTTSEQLIEAFAKKLGTHMIHFVPRDNMVQSAEINRKTVIEFDPCMFRPTNTGSWPEKIDGNKMFVIPKPMTTEELEMLLIEYGIAN